MKNWNNIKNVTREKYVSFDLKHFDTLEDAVALIRENELEFVNEPVSGVKIAACANSYPFRNLYIIRDDLGLIIPNWKIVEVWHSIPRDKWGYPLWHELPIWRNSYFGNWEFRSGPVPRTACRKPSHRNNRNGKPQLFQALKDQINVENDEDLKEYKFKRRAHTERLSFFRDWESPHYQEERNWKSFRKTQWKPKNGKIKESPEGDC